MSLYGECVKQNFFTFLNFSKDTNTIFTESAKNGLVSEKNTNNYTNNNNFPLLGGGGFLTQKWKVEPFPYLGVKTSK